MTTPPTQDDLAAGRELDALVAQNIMGWQPWLLDTHLGQITPLRNPATGEINPPAYSSDMGAAWEVIDCLVPRGWYFNLSVGGRELDTDPVWEARFSHYPDPDPEEEAETFTALAHTPALAICRAALKAVSV